MYNALMQLGSFEHDYIEHAVGEGRGGEGKGKGAETATNKLEC